MNEQISFILLIVVLIAGPIIGLLYAYNSRPRKTRLPTAEEIMWLAEKAVQAVSDAQTIYGDEKLSNKEKFSHAVDLMRDAIAAEGLVIDPELRDAVVNIVYGVLKPGFKNQDIPYHK